MIKGTSTIAVTAAGAASFTVSAPATATTGTGFNITITAKDQFGNTVTGYSGQVQLTSSDSQTVSPVTVNVTDGVRAPSR